MTKQLYSEHTFRETALNSVHPGYPIIVTKDNGDGTVQGHYDLDRMTVTQKIAALR